MERELWRLLYTLGRLLDKRRALGLYRDADVVGVYLWAVCHERNTSWAVDERNWPDELDVPIPSQPTMSRRLRSPAVEQLMEEVLNCFVFLHGMANEWVKVVDGKPLPVGGRSKDPDAHWGYASSGCAKGYKVFAIYGAGPLPLTWRVAAMNASEATMAKKMLPDLEGGGYLLGDSIYDSSELYRMTREHNHQLVAPRKRKGPGWGHRVQEPTRRRAADLLQSQFGEALFATRRRIEQHFAHLTNFGGGLSPLPNWVRRLHRVRLWVLAKILIYATWLLQKTAGDVLALE
jgi:hypothetical protein